MRDLARRLLDDFQHDFPLVPRPFSAIATHYGVSGPEVLAAFIELQATGALSRLGAVVAPHRVGASTLAAMAVPPERLAEVAQLVSAWDEVNHNYEREHRLNLWFVVTAPDAERLSAVLDGISRQTGLAVLDLPMEAEYHVDLGFRLQWE